MIKEGIFEDESVQSLIARHHEHCAAETSPCKMHRLDLDALKTKDIRFWTYWQGDEAAGCIALRDLGDKKGEIKSMHVRADQRGGGIADALLLHLEKEARDMGMNWLGLETGETPNFHAAIRFYQKHGYAPAARFGHYTAENAGPLFARKLED